MLVQGPTTSFQQEMLTGTHNFSASGGDTFKIALYTSQADLSSTTTAYTTSGEISGTGYSAGGATLTNVDPSSGGTTAYTQFSNVSWSTATFTTGGALIYNSSKSNKAVCVLNFGFDRVVTAGTFTVTMPVASATTALIQVVLWGQ